MLLTPVRFENQTVRFENLRIRGPARCPRITHASLLLVPIQMRQWQLEQGKCIRALVAERERSLETDPGPRWGGELGWAFEHSLWQLEQGREDCNRQSLLNSTASMHEVPTGTQNVEWSAGEQAELGDSSKML